MVKLDDWPILVLENYDDIPVTVEDYIYLTLNSSKFSYIKNIQYGKDEMAKFIKEALFTGHNVFVVQTTLMDDEQVNTVAEILDAIPYRINFHIRSGAASDLRFALIQLVGGEKTERLFKKHNIIEW